MVVGASWGIPHTKKDSWEKYFVLVEKRLRIIRHSLFEDSNL